MKIVEISERLATAISNELSYSDEKKEIIAYGIESLILAVIGFIAVLLVAFPLNVVCPAVSAAIFGGLLRKMSGGAHFNTPIKCLLFGTFVYSFLGVLAVKIIINDIYNTFIALSILIISLIIVVILAPVDCEAKPIHSPVFRRKLKIASIGFVVLTCFVVLFSNNYLLNTGAVLGIGYQTLTLLPLFNKKKKEVSV